MVNADVISMPDKWEYPWYAAWDLAFHAVTLALVDADFAKSQLLLMLEQRYLNPSGQMPAYEWNFGDVNPPVHAWAAWVIYNHERTRTGKADLRFLESIFQHLLMNFTWWVNRKDPQGNNVFEGGFLGLDNIGVFDRSAPLPTGGRLEQADGTAWMAFYCQTMLQLALELALHDPVYQNLAAKFYEHFLWIAGAMDVAGQRIDLWDEEDASSTTSCGCRRATPSGSRCGRWSGCSRCVRRRSFRPGSSVGCRCSRRAPVTSRVATRASSRASHHRAGSATATGTCSDS